MVQKITGEAPFQVLSTNFSISPSTEGYTLQISADGVNYTDLFAVGANVTRMVTGVANGSYYRLSGNNSTVSVNWRSQCTDGQSGGGGGEGSQGPQGPMGPQGYQGPAGSGEAGDSHILKVSSSAPSGLSEGDVYALHADGSPREIGSDWTDIGEVSYEWYEDFPQAVSIPLNNSEYFSVRFPYEDITTWRGDNGVIVENGELTMENINGWESDGENSYVLIDSEWMDRTSGASIHVFLENDTLYFYSDDVNRIWMAGIAEPSDEDHTISTGEITPAVPETMGVYQYNDGTIVELATKDDIPAKVNLVPDGTPNSGFIFRYDDKPQWVHPSDITNSQLINIETDSEAEDTYPTILKRTRYGDFRWGLPERKLEAVSALPTTYVDGAVYALANASGYGIYQVQSGASEMAWAHFEEKIPTGWTMARVPYTDDNESDLVGLHMNDCADEVNLYWHPEDAENKYWDGVDEQNDGEFTMTDPCDNSISCVRDGDYLVLTFSTPVTDVSGIWGNTEIYVETIVPNYVKIGEGGGAGGDIVHLNNLDAAGEEDVLYEFNNNYFKYTSASGTWGEWVVTPYDNVAFQGTSYLYYTKLPDSGITLCSTKIVNSISWLKYEPENERIDVYDNSSLTGTPVTSVTKNGVAVRIASSSRWLDVSWVEGKITFYTGSGFAGLAFTCNTDINGGHYEYVANPVENPVVDSSNGAIPKWNNKGQIVGVKWNYAEKPIRINNTGYSNTRKFLSGDGNVQWENWFFPTVGGTQGEVLVSGGESAEPVWTSWIKSVKITSAAYEALATKDPNTLYLIVD